jgi:bidirectional [NiFe] hydrogenase diaphorase subunit
VFKRRWKKEVQSGLEDVEMRGVGCLGLCAEGPLVQVEPEGHLYQGCAPRMPAESVIESLYSKPVKRLECPTDAPFFTRQQKIVLENSGRIDPEKLEDYRRRGL